jgi:hypothetical protein
MAGRVIPSLTLLTFKTRHQRDNRSMFAEIALTDALANTIDDARSFMPQD